MSRPIKNFIYVVDGHRPPSKQRSTHGRYRVGARDEKTAEKILRKHIKFGSPCLLCEDTEGKMLHTFHSHIAQLHEIIKEC